MSTKKNKLSKKKPLVYVLLAKAYDTDTRVIQEVNSLTRNGFRALVLAWDRDNKFKSSNSDNIKVKNLALIPSKLFNKFLYILSALLLQITILIHGSFLMLRETELIIHANDFNTLPGGALLKFFFPRSIKLVYDSHEHTPAAYEEWFSRSISKIVSVVERIFIKLVDAVITVSSPIKEYLATIFRKEIFIIRNYPVQTVFPRESKLEARIKLGYNEKQFLATFVGVMRLDIAIPEIVEAAKIIKEKRKGKDREIKIILVGDGPLFDFVQEKKNQYELHDTIDLIGRVERELALIYLKASDLSLIVGKGESFNSKIGTPWKLYESLSNNVPVMVKANTTMADIVSSRGAGVVLEDLAPEEIATRLKALASNSKEHRFEIKDDFTWESQEDNLVKIYKNI